LLVHGWEGRGTQLGGFVEPLLAQGFRIVAVDGPAHGDTPGNRSNVVHFAQFLKEVGDALGEIYAVIAHSVGGASTTLAMQQGMKIQRAVLIASPSSLPAVAERFAAWLHLPTDAKRHFFIALERAIGMPLADIEVRKIVADFEQPALLLHDPEDREIPFAASEATAKVWPGARLMPLSGVGHRGILKSPVVVAEVVRFISEPAADSVLYLAVM
jgi:pimeloyl-ACP methyl ester carboxylesterase